MGFLPIKRIGVLMGGWSSEREVSLVSGNNVLLSLNNLGYETFPIDVKKDLPTLLNEIKAINPCVIFNALHGVGGEDGVIQGVLEILEIPYTHSGVAASSLAMNKVLSRKIFEKEGLTVPLSYVSEVKMFSRPIPFPYVLKPINEGSSQGVHLIFNEKDEEKAFEGWAYGKRVLIEEYLSGQEIHAAVINGDSLGAVETRPYKGFYDYKNKYTPGLVEHIFPPEMPEEDYKKILELALKAYKSLLCKGVAYCDFIYQKESRSIYILELNSQPGLTPLSLVPEIASYSGISFDHLIEKMIETALCG